MELIIMKKAVSLIVAMLMCISLVAPVCAAEFVPSITDKNAPEIVGQTDEDGNVIVGHVLDDEGNIIDVVYDTDIVVTPVSQAEESDEIPEEAKDQLLEVYGQLEDGSEILPYGQIDEDLDPDDMVIRDVIDISWVSSDPDSVTPTDGNVSLTFDLGVAPGTNVYVFTYQDGSWIPAIDVVNNGDGTVDLILENFGPVVFSVEAGEDSKPSQTGDTMDITLWVALMAVSAVALIAVVCFRRKFV